MTVPTLDVLLVSDFTCDLFAGYLENGEELPKVKTKTSGYGQVMSVLASDAPAEGSKPDVAIVWTRPEAVIPSFARMMRFEAVTTDELLADVRAFGAAIQRFSDKAQTILVPSWVLPSRRPYGLLEMKPGRGIAHALIQMNLALCSMLDEKGIFVLQTERWLGSGAGAFSAKRWYMGKVPFENSVFRDAARDIKACLRGLYGQGRKLVVVDLDDTLWGGIVGDDGWENLQLGGHDAGGEALVDFQHALKALTRRGILLAIVSKNTESVALEAINSHPEMVLKVTDFAAWRINWQDKARNIADLVEELNLGLQSVVFIDDNPLERARVRETLPEVLVPEWPVDKTQYCSALSGLDCFETAQISEEDRQRSQMYATERERQSLRSEVGSIEEWLLSLGTTVTAEPLNDANAKRTVQLLNKTNQINLRTRRMAESDLASWAAKEGRCVWAFSVRDRFGAAGLTGIVSVSIQGTTAAIEDFVLSCRVMSRRVEETMLHTAARFARDAGANTLVAGYIATAKNAPCLEFLQRSGMQADASGHAFTWDLASDYPLPPSVTVERTND
jgi:FkbH-like protein